MATQNAIKTQGTKLFVYNPEGSDLYKVGGVTAIGGASAPASQIDTTDLESQVRTFVAGLREPGSTSFSVNFDPSNPEHAKIFELYKSGTVVEFIIVMTDGTDEPTITTGEITLPTTTSYLTFSGYVTEVPLDFESNSVLNTTVGIQISGDVDLHAKTAA